MAPFPGIEDATSIPPLAARYRLVEPIARGGVAWVWRAHDLTLDRPVAVKVLRADADPALAARFTSEAQAAARIRHPGVVAVYDAGIHDGVPFLAMELLEGETLRARLSRSGALPAAEVRRLGRELAAALDAIRRAGLVHGDVKPENVILTASGAPTITDLGLARAIWETGTDSADAVWGTPGYLAPERRRGEPGDHRSDVYSLGALLFECATGAPPPAEGELPWASLVNREVPEELSAAIARATLADPDERYPTAAAFAVQLAGEPSGAAGNETSALPVHERETVAMPAAIQRRAARAATVRRRRRRILLAAGLVVALLGGFLMLGPVARTTVPLVEGRERAAAEAALTAAGLEAEISFENDSTVPAGDVISQDPPDGASIRRGGVVAITVSLGPRLVRVPEVAGLAPGRAARKLEDAGFDDVVRRNVFSTTVREGRVVGTDPPEGELAEADGPLVLQVSKGPDNVAIPATEGLRQAVAVERLQRQDFETHITREASRSVAEGRVIRTSPAAGAEAPRGSTVTVVVSSGPPPTTVPNLGCMSKGQAKDALRAASLNGNFEGSGSRVVDQSPPPGETVPEGSTVDVFLGFGVFCGDDD